MNFRLPLAWSIISGAVIIAATIAMTNRWEAAVSNGGIVRLDRWTGSVVVCALKSDAYSLASEMEAGVEARCTLANPAEIESYQRRSHQESTSQQRTDTPLSSSAYDDAMKQLKERARPSKPSAPNTK